MKKGIYIHCGSKAEFTGVTKKINDQINVFSKKFEIREIVVEKEKTNALISICWRLPGGSFGRKYDDAFKSIVEFCGTDKLHFAYLRHQALDKAFVSFVNRIKATYKNAKIIVEIPTYPYGKELLRDSTMWPWYFKDLFYRKRYGRLLDRIVTYSDDTEIFNVPTIRTMNGLDVDSIRVANVPDKSDDTIRMLVVAMMQPYHGFERLIKGMGTYYSGNPERNVELIMVGYGPELDYYKNLTNSLGLNDKIIFMGKLVGEELDNIYDSCDITVGSMGGYKIGIEVFSSIKLGEYLAKGLPVLTGARTLIFDKFGHDYNLEFTNDATEIDIDRVIKFYDKIYGFRDKSEVRHEIRQFAIEHIDVNVVMKSITDYLEND